MARNLDWRTVRTGAGKGSPATCPTPACQGNEGPPPKVPEGRLQIPDFSGFSLSGSDRPRGLAGGVLQARAEVGEEALLLLGRRAGWRGPQIERLEDRLGEVGEE